MKHPTRIILRRPNRWGSFDCTCEGGTRWYHEGPTLTPFACPDCAGTGYADQDCECGEPATCEVELWYTEHWEPSRRHTCDRHLSWEVPDLEWLAGPAQD